MTRIPSWACEHYVEHGEAICQACLDNYQAQGCRLTGRDRLPPRVEFRRGWLSMGANHWFEATDSTVFPSRDAQRTLAQAICGTICNVTTTWAPQSAGNECTKCVRALGKVAVPSSPVHGDQPDSGGPAGGRTSKGTIVVRLYRGLKEPYDPNRPSRDPRSGTDFTDCPLTALSYATGSKGTVVVVDVDTTGKHVFEGLWVGPKIKRYLVREYQDDVVAVIPAIELRAQIRRKGVASTTDDHKAEVLTAYIEQRIDEE